MFLSPHPDDETIGCGGILCHHTAAGDPVKVVFLTNGAKGDLLQQDKEGYVSLRKAEAEEACGALGVSDFEFWLCEDRQLMECAGATERLVDLLHDFNPELVYVPSPMEYHPDHRAASLLLEAAIKHSSEPTFTVAFYEIGQPMRINTLVDITPVLEKKKAALYCYPSQLQMRSYSDISIALNRFRSMTLGENTTHAEGFYLCSAEGIRGTGALQIIQQDMDRLFPYHRSEKEVAGKPSQGPILPDDAEKLEDLPLVSVILPTYNRPDMLVKAIESILSQTYPNFEIIVVNDGGENVAELIASRNASGKIIYLHHSAGQGVSSARNTGLKAAKGKYIAYLDDDDLYYPDHLQRLVAALEQSGYDVAYTDAHEQLQRKINGEYVSVGERVAYSRDFDFQELLVKNYIPTLNICHRRDIIEDVGPFDESLETHEDWDLWIRMARKYPFRHIPKVTALWTKRADRTSITTRDRKRILKVFEEIHSRYAHLIEDPAVLEAQKAVERMQRLDIEGEETKAILAENGRFHQYALLCEAVEGKRVVDIGCGEGWGSFLLSESARSVVGIEGDAGKIRQAKNRYIRKNLHFIQGTAKEFAKSSPERFDVALCFDFCRNESAIRDLLWQAAGLLQPEGTLFFSVVFSDDGEDETSISFEEMERILSEQFKSVRWWGQKCGSGSSLFSLSDSDGDAGKAKTFLIENIPSGYRLVSEEKERAASFFAAATDSQAMLLLPNRSSLFDLSDTLRKHWENHRRELNELLSEKNGRIAHLQSVMDDRKNHIEALAAEQKRQHLQVESLKAEQDRLLFHIRTLEEERRGHLEHIKNLNNEREGQGNHIHALAVERDQQRKHIQNLENEQDQQRRHIQNLENEREQQRRHIQNLEIEQVRQKSHMEQQKASLAELEKEVKEKTEQLIESIEEIHSIRSSFYWKMGRRLGLGN